MERNHYHRADFRVVETKPGMYADRKDALNGAKGILIGVVGSIILAATVIGGIHYFANHQEQALPWFTAAVFSGCAAESVRMVLNRAKYDLGTRAICGFVGVLSVFGALFALGVGR